MTAAPAGRPSAAQAFLNQAMKFKGQPYKWGGGHGNETFSGPGPVDCSGLVTQAARMQGLKLGGTAKTLRAQGQPVSLNALNPGDLVFRGTKHVGIYAGNGQVLHAPRRGQPVQMTGLKGWDAARRPFGGAAAAPVPAGQAVAPKARAAAPTGGGMPTASASAVALPEGKPATAAAAPGGDYTVKPGDSLSKIAGRLLGDASRWPEIHALNKDLIDNPNKIFPGQSLKLPTPNPETTTPKAEGAATQTPAAAKGATTPGLGNFTGLMGKLGQAGVTPAQLEDLSRRHGVPLKLALGVIQQESGGNPNARSGVGATGLMQLMPGTAKEMGVQNARDPHQNLEGGFKYLGKMLKQFGGDTTKALAAYNAGPGNVRKYGGVPPFAETQEYVRKISASIA
jgi:LysM repeat protein